MKQAFTLIEIVVAVAIFSLVIGAGSGLFVSVIRAQRKSLAFQELLSQLSYTLEYMTRSIRMAKKELNCLDPDDPETCDRDVNPPYCLTGADYGYGYNYEKTRGGNGLKFINDQDICQEFFLEGSRLKESKGGDEKFLTSDKLEVTAFDIEVSGQSQDDDLQPFIILFLKIKGRGKPGEQPEMAIQTSISQRNLDVVE